jgi:AcrR family transcriptional regulator
MTSSPRRDWRSERRQKILSAAADLFSRNSYEAVQMRDIAGIAEVGKPTLYRYFPSKEELFLEVFKRDLDRLDVAVAEIAAMNQTPRQALESLVHHMVGALGGQVAALRLLTDDQSEVMHRWRSEFRRRRRPIVEAMRNILEQGIAVGEFRPVDLETVPSMLIAVVRGGLVGAHHVPRERVTAAMIDLVIHALATETKRAEMAATAHAA